MSDRTAMRIRRGATLAAAALSVVAAWLLWRTNVPELDVPELDAAATFGADAVAEADAYARVPRLLWAGRTAAELLVLVALVLAAPRLARRVRSPFLLLLLTLAALWVVRLPFRAVGHWWRRRHGLSDQAYGAWLVDPWLETLALVVLAAAALAVAIALERRFGRGWWLPGGVALAVLGALVVLVQPLVLAPRLDPLRDEALVAEIRELGTRLGVEVGRVEVKEARERTTRVNAEVAGIGPTRTVILWDTLLGRADDAEIRFLAAHELAHVARRHLWKGVAWFALLAPALAFAVAAATRGRGGVAAPAAAPAAVLALVALELALLPAVNAVSRRYEAEADWTALQATRDPAGAGRLLRRFVAANLADPTPPRWAHVVLGSHPTLLDRVQQLRAAATRATGHGQNESARAGSRARSTSCAAAATAAGTAPPATARAPRGGS